MNRPFASLDAAAEAAILEGARGSQAARDAAFEALFVALREPVLALCLHLTGRRVDADDAFQETFLSVHRALPAFRGEARLSTWVYRIALRAGLLQLHRRRDHAELDPGAAPVEGGEARLAARDEARRVLAAMEGLPAEQRAVLALFAIDGLGHRAIADVLGVPEGTVWSRLHAARRRLQESLSPCSHST